MHSPIPELRQIPKALVKILSGNIVLKSKRQQYVFAEKHDEFLRTAEILMIVLLLKFSINSGCLQTKLSQSISREEAQRGQS